MKLIKFTLLTLMLCASVMTFAKPKKGKNTQNTTKVVKLSCTLDSDGTLKNVDGEVIGKLNSDGNVVNAAGHVIGSIERTSKEKIGEAYPGSGD